MRVVLTRPEPANQRTAALLRHAGHTVLATPLFHVQALEPAWPEAVFDALVLTSENAVPFASRYRALPVYAIGSRTAEAARQVGFTVVSVSAGGVGALAASLRGQHGSILHLSGFDQAADLAALLPHAMVQTLAVYQSVAEVNLPKLLAAALCHAQVDAVLHYSPRAAALFVELVEKAGLIESIRALQHICLSEAVAQPLKRVGIRHICSADQPNEQALLAFILK